LEIINLLSTERKTSRLDVSLIVLSRESNSHLIRKRKRGFDSNQLNETIRCRNVIKEDGTYWNLDDGIFQPIKNEVYPEMTEIRTENAIVNAPMLSNNRRLGFKTIHDRGLYCIDVDELLQKFERVL